VTLVALSLSQIVRKPLSVSQNPKPHPLQPKQVGQSLPTSGSCSILPGPRTDALNDAMFKLRLLAGAVALLNQASDFIRRPTSQKRCRRPCRSSALRGGHSITAKNRRRLDRAIKLKPTDSIYSITNSQSEHSFGTRAARSRATCCPLPQCGNTLANIGFKFNRPTCWGSV
jgi:hypothetical protein